MKKVRYISLPPGRNAVLLTDQDQRRVGTTFLGFEPDINAKYEAGTYTRFIVSTENGNDFGEIIFSEDILPGPNVVNPNSLLSLSGAAAHELSHYHRWFDGRELLHGFLTEIDEAITSLEAAQRYGHQLRPTDIQGLISDALFRLNIFVQAQKAQAADDSAIEVPPEPAQV